MKSLFHHKLSHFLNTLIPAGFISVTLYYIQYIWYNKKHFFFFLEPGSVRGFFPLKGSFSLPLSPSAWSCWVSVNQRVWCRPALYEQCPEITSVVVWHYINKMDLTWLLYFVKHLVTLVLKGAIEINLFNIIIISPLYISTYVLQLRVHEN